jgi:hypothetical protein
MGNFDEQMKKFDAELRELSRQMATIFWKQYQLEQERVELQGDDPLPRFEVWLEMKYKAKADLVAKKVWDEYHDVLFFWRTEILPTGGADGSDKQTADA